MPRPKSKAEDDPEVQAVRQALAPAPSTQLPDEYLSTGITGLNLILSGHPQRGLLKGRYYHVVGDSGSGKTAIAMQILAEAAKSKRFREYDLVYDGPENGLGMDVTTFFGEKTAARVRPPKGTFAAPEYSVYLEDFSDNMDAMYRTDKPFIYILDSMDAIEPRGDAKREAKKQGERAKGKDVESNTQIGGDKPRLNGSVLRRAANLKLPKTGSILIVISQTRDKMPKPGQIVLPGADMQTYSGGHALKFYCSAQVWMSTGAPIKKRAKSREWAVGNWVKFKVKKNRGTGRPYTAETPFLYTVGFDDLAGCVQFLLDIGHWKGAKGPTGKVVKLPGKMPATPEFPDFAGGSADALIRHIEYNNLEGRLRKLVGEAWHQVESELATERKRRYT